MKKNLLTSCLFLSMLTGASAQILNPGFDTWQAVTNQYTAPTDWYTNNSSLVNSHVVLPYTPSHTGAFAAMVITEYNPSYQTTIAGNLYDNVAYNQRPVALKGYYKAVVQPGDTVQVIVVIKNGGTVTGTDTLRFTTSQPNYTLFSAPITYTNGAVTDNVEIFFQAGNVNPTLFDLVDRSGDTLIVDDLVFDLGTGIQDPVSNLPAYVYPNPAKGQLFIKGAVADNTVMSVYNTLGELQYQSAVNNEKSSVNISSLASGIYFVKLNEQGHESVQKVVVE